MHENMAKVALVLIYKLVFLNWFQIIRVSQRRSHSRKYSSGPSYQTTVPSCNDTFAKGEPKLTHYV